MYLVPACLFFVLFSHQPTPIHGELEGGYFKTRSCNHGDMDSFAQSMIYSARSNYLTCAFACNQFGSDCLRALYNSTENVCKESYFPSWYQEFGNDADKIVETPLDIGYECLVLIKQDMTPSSDVDVPILTTLSSPTSPPTPYPIWSSLSFIPMNLITKEETVTDHATNETGVVFQVTQASHVTARNDIMGHVFTTKPTVVTVDVAVGGTFSYPLRQEIKTLTMSGGNNVVDVYDVWLSGKRTERRNHSSEILVGMARNYYSGPDGKTTGILFADSLSAVIGALKKGYRRVETHPTRSVISTSDYDVYFDMTEILAVESGPNKYPPFHATSFKESVKDKERYVFRNRLNDGASSPGWTEMTTPWVFETSWDKILLSNWVYNDLTFLILQGKEIRVILEDEISTDVVSVRMTSSDVILYLPQYIVPLKGKDVDANDIRARFPVISASMKLLECEMQYQNSSMIQMKSSTYSKIDWFVSRTNWTKVYVVKMSDPATGSLEDLKQAVTSGFGVRMCLHTASNTYCYSGDSIRVSASDEIVLQSPPYLDTSDSNLEELKAIESGCPRRMQLVSTAGTLQIARYTVGFKSTASWAPAAFLRQEWFVNYDGPWNK